MKLSQFSLRDLFVVTLLGAALAWESRLAIDADKNNGEVFATLGFLMLVGAILGALIGIRYRQPWTLGAWLGFLAFFAWFVMTFAALNLLGIDSASRSRAKHRASQSLNKP